jgi:hypothetical protein
VANAKHRTRKLLIEDRSALRERHLTAKN